jgi:hypothetical protein
MYDIIEDIEACSCCSRLKHEKKIKTVGSLIEAADYLANNYYNDQLLSGLYDNIIIKKENEKYSASECLKSVGYNKQVLNGIANKKKLDALKWLNLSITTQPHSGVRSNFLEKSLQKK